MKKNYYVGCDVSKGYADFVIIDNDKKIVEKNFQLDDTKEGHRMLFQKLSELQKPLTEQIHIYVGLESTGGYENNWYNGLYKFGNDKKIKVTRLNPIGVYHHGKSEMKRNSTDKISAKNIAEYLINHSDKVNYEENDGSSSLRRVWTIIQLLTKQKTSLMNSLEKLLYVGNTEILNHCKNGMNDWTLKLLKNYPTAKKLSKAPLSKLGKIKYLKKSLSIEIKQSAKNSISSISDKTIEIMIRDLSDKILNLNESIKSHLKELNNVTDSKNIEILESFDGIGIYSAVGLLIEISGWERFASAKKIASYFGLHPVYRESGDGVWGIHMSKTGRKTGRSILYMVAMSAIQTNRLIKELYEKCLKNGMCKMSAIGVCMHKIIRIVYGMLKSQKKFDYAIDKKNQKKIVVSNHHQKKKNEKRRFQNYNEKAPISRKETKKRKERIVAS